MKIRVMQLSILLHLLSEICIYVPVLRERGSRPSSHLQMRVIEPYLVFTLADDMSPCEDTDSGRGLQVIVH